MYTLNSITSQPVPHRTLTISGPLVIQHHDRNHCRYHVAGHGFSTENLHDATRYAVNALSRDFHLDPFVPKGGHLTALALVELIAIEETVILASWGEKTLVLSPTNFHAESFAIIRPLLDGFVTSGGTPFGSTLSVKDPHGSGLRGAIFNVGFQLPTGVEELLAPLSVFGVSTPREILTRLELLGFRIKGKIEPQGFTVWQRHLANHELQLETGFSAQPTRISLLAPQEDPLHVSLDFQDFAHIHSRLIDFLTNVKSTDAGGISELFANTFKHLTIKL